MYKYAKDDVRFGRQHDIARFRLNEPELLRYFKELRRHHLRVVSFVGTR